MCDDDNVIIFNCFKFNHILSFHALQYGTMIKRGKITFLNSIMQKKSKAYVLYGKQIIRNDICMHETICWNVYGKSIAGEKNNVRSKFQVHVQKLCV